MDGGLVGDILISLEHTAFYRVENRSETNVHMYVPTSNEYVQRMHGKRAFACVDRNAAKRWSRVSLRSLSCMSAILYRQAHSMGKGAFITTFTSDSVEVAAKGNPKQFTVAKSEGVLASEEMLRVILAACS